MGVDHFVVWISGVCLYSLELSGRELVQFDGGRDKGGDGDADNAGDDDSVGGRFPPEWHFLGLF